MSERASIIEFRIYSDGKKSPLQTYSIVAIFHGHVVCLIGRGYRTKKEARSQLRGLSKKITDKLLCQLLTDAGIVSVDEARQ